MWLQVWGDMEILMINLFAQLLPLSSLHNPDGGSPLFSLDRTSLIVYPLSPKRHQPLPLS